MRDRCRASLITVALLAGCATTAPDPGRAAGSAAPTPRPSRTAASASPVATPPPTEVPQPVEVRYRLERRTKDPATAGFAATVEATLSDARGWRRGDVRLIRDDAAPYLVVLAEPDEVQRLCRPYDIYGRYSCQNGPVVALNAERWRHATPQWTGTLPAYRQMLVNHEVGHLLGLHHPPSPHCPRRGAIAPVMSQQSTELDGCRPNPWPLPSEVQLLARHDLPLAPPPD